MWQEEQVKSLSNEIDALLEPLRHVAGLHRLLTEALAEAEPYRAGRATDQPWALLPLIICEGICGSFETALPAAAAIQLFKSAAEVLDDVEDADSSRSLAAVYGNAAAINAGTALVVLAEKAIARLHYRRVPDATIVRVVDAVNALYTTACAGQHLDLTLGAGFPSEESYLRMVTMKSSSHVECACRIGAMVAGAGDPAVESYAAFGRSLGVAVQIGNDVQGIESATDVAKRRITLPVIYALSNTDGPEAYRLSAWYRTSESKSEAGDIRDLLVRRGATYYSSVKAEMFRHAALESLLKANPAEATLSRLKMFVERPHNL